MDQNNHIRSNKWNLVGKLFRKIGGLEGYLRGYMSIEQIEVGIVGGLFLVITTD